MSFTLAQFADLEWPVQLMAILVVLGLPIILVLSIISGIRQSSRRKRAAQRGFPIVPADDRKSEDAEQP